MTFHGQASVLSAGQAVFPNPQGSSRGKTFLSLGRGCVQEISPEPRPALGPAVSASPGGSVETRFPGPTPGLRHSEAGGTGSVITAETPATLELSSFFCFLKRANASRLLEQQGLRGGFQHHGFTHSSRPRWCQSELHFASACSCSELSRRPQTLLWRSLCLWRLISPASWERQRTRTPSSPDVNEPEVLFYKMRHLGNKPERLFRGFKE